MTIRNLTDALTACDLQLPAKAAEWLDKREALQATAAVAPDTRVETATETLTAKNASEIVDRLTRQRLEAETRDATIRQLIADTEARALRAAKAEADTIIGQARKGFDAAAKVVARDAAAFHSTDTPNQVLARGSDAAEAWTRIQRASEHLDAAAHLWLTVHERPVTADAVVATFEGDHWRRVDAQETFTGPNRWHALIAAGYSLQLNTLQETAALIAATPEKEMRAERAYREGFVSTALVRD